MQKVNEKPYWKAITAFQMTYLFTSTFSETATIASKCFKVSGIYPYNPDTFTEVDFLPNAVTAREINDNQHSTRVQSTKA